MMIRRGLLTLLTLGFLACSPLLSAEPAKKVLYIGIDGTRTDALLAARAPNLHKLIETGAFSQQTQILSDRNTGSDTVSGPGWSSHLTGVWADKHGVKDNAFRDPHYDAYPHFFKRVKDARPSAYTVSLVTWEPIHKFIVSNADDSRSLLEKGDWEAGDRRVAEEAVRILREKNPDVMFVYFGNVDETGHKFGFHPKVPQYMAQLALVDRHVGAVLAALRARPTFADEDWLILAGTDHGGAGLGHGKGHENPDVRQVWFLANGPSVVPGKIEGPTALVDFVPTALTHLGIPIQPEWKLDGQPRALKSLAQEKN